MTADEADIRACIGPPLEEGLRRLGVPVGELGRGVAIYRAYFAEAGIFDNRLYPGAADLLAGLTGAGVDVALATSKLQAFAETVLDHFGVARYFSVVVGSSRDGTRLHKEDIVGYALGLLGTPDRSTVAMVGDRQHDMYAAVAHGLCPVGVLWGYGSPEELTGSGADIVFETVADLAAFLMGGGADPPPAPS